jgi:hypothetical protein
MPATYSFTTPLVLPTSTEFPCWDFQPANMPTILLFPQVSQSRGTPWIEIDVDNDLVVRSDDGVASTVEIELAISNKFTLETNFKPKYLPLNMTDLTQNCMFIGAFDKNDNGGGVLLSQAGLAIVSEIPPSATPLPGSQDLIAEGDDYYTLRITVDGDLDVMNVYLTKTAVLGGIGHQLRYTTSAPASPTLLTDLIKIEVIGQAARAIDLRLDTLSMNCTEALVPNRRPVADAGADQTASLGSSVGYDGTNSYDPEGELLSYAWALTDAPDGSRYKINGVEGSTSDDGDADGFTNIFDGGGTVFSEDDAPTLQPGDHLDVAGVIYEISTDRWVLDPGTGLYVRDGTWVDSEIVITTDTLPDSLTGETWKVLHSKGYFDDPTASTPVAIPDLVGIYTVQLIVNDGELDSLADYALLNVASTSVILGCIPDVSFIWAHISDFWNLVEDREVVETAWTGFAQAAAAQLLTLWQTDYNKSLLDAQRLFQRRWLNYSLLVDDDPDTATIRFIRGPLFSQDLAAGANVDGETLQLVLDAGDVQTITFSGANPISVTDIADQINAGLGMSGSPIASVVTSGAEEFVKLEYATLLRIRPNGTANTDLGFSTTDYTQNDLQGLYGGIAEPTQTTAFVTTDYATGTKDPPVLDFDTEGVGSSDLVVWDAQGYRVQKTALQGTEKRALTLLDALPDSGSVSPAVDPDRKPWVVPSVVISAGVDFATELVGAGDLARFEVKDLVNGGTVEILCEVLGAAEKRLGFDPKPLLEKYAGVPSNYQTEFVGVRRAVTVPVSEYVLEIPRLQEIIQSPPTVLNNNTDFTIQTGADQNTIVFTEGTFTINDPPPDMLWAEITYLDNNPTIEANFGRMVNFSVEQMEDRLDDLDYLSAVQGLWWSYFGGPAIDKVRTGVQILLGLPFAEAEGTIEEINEIFSLTEGRLLIRDVADQSILRSYFYPRNAGLAVNQLTGNTIAVGDTIAQFAPLSGGIEVSDWKNDPDWMQGYASQGHFVEIEKFFHFMVRGDVDTFDLTNMVFAIDFVRKIKPHYTKPLFVVLKNIDEETIDVTDQFSIDVTLNLFDNLCPSSPGAYRWDDTDESGVIQHSYDDPFPQFAYDTLRLCPSEFMYVIIGATLPAGPWEFDSIWAYDDGDTDGDTISDDIIPLSGPDSSPPPPYGPLVGTITYDASITAGKYTRSKAL